MFAIPTGGLDRLSAQPSILPSQAQAQLTRSLVSAINTLNSTSHFGENNQLIFHFDRVSRLVVVQIVDRETKEIVEQIPAEYVLQLADGR